MDPQPPETETADEAASAPAPKTAVTMGAAVGSAGLLLTSALVPLTPGGASFAGLVLEVAARSPIDAVLFVLGFGGPYLFALGLAFTALGNRSSLPRWILQSTLALFQAQLFLWAFRAWYAGVGLAPGALFGFSAVSAGYLIYFSARTSAEQDRGDGPSVRWLARWGALLVLGVAGWLRLQWAAGLHMGPALEVGMLGAAILLFATRPR